MKITLDMPNVADCEVSDCAYNIDKGCHARAITVGDGSNPGCDTFCDASAGHVRSRSQIAGVGACKVSGCVHNSDLECSAQHITVGFAGDRVNCLTYTAR